MTAALETFLALSEQDKRDVFSASAVRQFWLELFEHRFEHAVPGPDVHAGVDGVPDSEASGQSMPLATLYGGI